MILKNRSVLTVIALIALTSSVAVADTAPRATVANLPLAFTENLGQWPDSILFRADAGLATMWFTQSGAYYQFTRRTTNEYRRPGLPAERTLETDIIRVVFAGAQTPASVNGESQTEGRYHFFLGDDPAAWRTDVRAYRALVFEDIYPGIDLKYYGHGGQMEYDFIAAPGADLSQICIRYEGAQSVSVNALGELIVKTEWATVTERTPFAYQVDGDERIPVTAVYEPIDDRTFGFALLDPIAPDLALVVDPVLTYSSYLGGSGVEIAFAVATDEFGNAYVAGATASTNFPTQDPYQTDQGGEDAFVIKLSDDGQTLVYGTYLGGSAPDQAWGLAVDDKGDAYVVGVTESTNFPTVNPYQTDQTLYDGFVTKLNGLGNDLVYSTYLGGSSTDELHDVAVDAQGHAYVVGVTGSSNFPTKGPYQTDQAGDDGSVTKLAPSGDSLIYSTFLGGNGIDATYAIAIDGDGNAYVTGQTRSTNFPNVGAYQGYQGDWDAYATKLNAAGDDALYSTYLGGALFDGGQGITVDGSGQAYVVGATSSTDFPTVSAYQTDLPGNDAFLVKLSTAGDAPVYSTYLGGNNTDYARAVGVDAGGHAFVAGWTLSTNFPTVDPIQVNNDTVDAFVVIFNTAGSALDFGTYLSGSGVDDVHGIVVAPNGDACVAGRTDSPNFLTLNPYQGDQIGRDAFVLMLEADPVAVEEDGTGPPEDFELQQNYPNPFNPTTVVRFTLVRASKVELTVYNTLGAKVATLCDRLLQAGPQEIRWDGRNDAGIEMPSGVYIYRLRAGDAVREEKMTLLK